ncbi:MAG: hypothetical protein IJL78_03635 [Lachnospiraceae bacterium]|nr:hypothetical protein [Lachnospiraceae bacterium]
MIKTYKCPGCGASLIYAGGTEDLKCPHCDRTVPVSEIAEQNNEAEVLAAGRAEDESRDNAGTNVREFQCPSCGAALVTTDHTSATQCAFCGAPTLIESRLTGEFKPGKILPFRFDKAQAQENFKNWKGTGKLTPSSFKSAAVMDKVTGVYVPYWLYSYSCEADIFAEGTRTRIMEGQKERVIMTDHFNVQRTSSAQYRGLPYEASTKIPEETMAVLEPFDYDKLTDFSFPYLAGFQAEKYHFPASEMQERAREAVRQDLINAAVADIDGYESVSLLNANVRFLQEQADYALLPVWTLNYEYMGKNYPLYMNGQSGEIDGELPTSKFKLFLRFAIAFLICFGLAFLFGRIL